MATLERAIEVAARAHAGQFDKGGQPYILHPLRVMLRVSGEARQIVAVLHDVIEDTNVTLTYLAQEGFSAEILDALDALTKRRSESRIDAAYRASANAIARVVKLEDNLDNSDLSRIPNPSDSDLARVKEYRKVRDILLASFTEADKEVALRELNKDRFNDFDPTNYLLAYDDLIEYILLAINEDNGGEFFYSIQTVVNSVVNNRLKFNLLLDHLNKAIHRNKRMNATRVSLLRSILTEFLDSPDKQDEYEVEKAGSIDGVVKSVAVEGNAAHVVIEAKNTCRIGCAASIDIARELGVHLCGGGIRLHGDGVWLRNRQGEWSVKNFLIKSFEVLRQENFDVTLHRIRNEIGDDIESIPDVLNYFSELRDGG